MNDLLIGLGMLLAIIGPLLLVPVIWAVHYFVLKPFFGSTWKSISLAILLAVTALTLSYLPGKRSFDDLCAQQGPPVVSEQVKVAGFYRTQMFPYEAVLYLTQNGFEFVEAPNPYDDDVTIRYSFAPNREVRQDDVKELRSKYGVRKTYSLLDGGVSRTEKVIYEIETGRELAHAVESVFQGGPLSIFLGTLGMGSCPDPRAPGGARDFEIFYELEQIVLHLIDREYAEVIDKSLSLSGKVVSLARAFRSRLTSLVANWIRVGYCQGNFNSDNCAAHRHFTAANGNGRTPYTHNHSPYCHPRQRR